MARSIRVAAAIAAVAVITLLPAAPANATVHEIVGQWCSGQEPLDPPGISGGSNADNFARPLTANGMEMVVPHADGLLVTFDWDHPASKVQSSGRIIPIGALPDGTPLYLELPAPDENFAAFRHCPAMAS